MVKTTVPQKKQWQNLTDTRKLRHIENTLDKAIATIQTEGGVESLEDFKNFVEDYSEQSGKAPITVELCTETGSDEIKGFRFYLSKDPNQRTSGKYLIKNLENATDKDENYFTPHNVMNLLGIEVENVDDLDLDTEDEDLDLESDLDDLDEDERPSTKKQSRNRSQKPTSKAAKLNTKGKVTEVEEDDTDPESLLEDDDVDSVPPRILPRTVHKSERINQPAKDFADNLVAEVSHLSANAATKGSEINGINEVGLAGQLAGLGIALGTQSMTMLEDLLQQIQEQGQQKRLEDILKDLEEKDARIGKLFQRIQKIVETTPAAELPEELVPLAEIFKPTSSQSETQTNNPIASAAIQVGEKIDKLGNQLDPEYESQPLQLDKNTPVSEQLNQIEKYLQKLSKRLDRLEAIVSELEEKLSKRADVEVDSVMSPPTNETQVLRQTSMNVKPQQTDEKQLSGKKPTVVHNKSKTLESDDEDLDFDDEELLVSEKISGDNRNLETADSDDILERIVLQRKMQQQGAACAESLVNYAAVTAKVTQQSLKEGIPLNGGSTLFVEGNSNQRSFTLQSDRGQELFAGTKKDGQWNIHSDSLKPEEKEHILNLPQSVDEYAIKASAQALVQKFEETFPKRFSGEKEPTFTWKENKQPKYEFEILSLKGSKVLQGFDPRQGDKQVFEAVLVDGQPPNIKKCLIPVAEMESLLGEPEVTQSAKPDRIAQTKKVQMQA